MSSSAREKIGRGSPSTRSRTDSQRSDVADVLAIAPAVRKRNKLGADKHKTNLQNLSGNKRVAKPKLSQSVNVTKTKNSVQKKQCKRPAWSLKPAVDDDVTPRSDISAASTYNLPTRPSLNDFLDFPEDDQDFHLSALPLPDVVHKETKIPSHHQDLNEQTLLEYLAANTTRSEGSDEKNVLESLITTDEKPPDNRIPALDLGDVDDDKDLHQVKTFNKSNLKMECSNIVYDSHPSNKISRSKMFDKRAIPRDSLDYGSKNVFSLPPDINRRTLTEKSNPKGLEEHISMLKRREKAAKLIQTWWRKARIRKTAGAAAMRRMLENKQKQLETKFYLDRENELNKQIEESEQRKRQDEKKRATRQSAITQMQNKRGKVNKQRTCPMKEVDKKTYTFKTKNASQYTKEKPSDLSTVIPLPDDEKPNTTSSRPSTSSSVGRKIEEIFEASSKDDISGESLPNVYAMSDDNSTLVLDSSLTRKSTYEDLLNTLKELEGKPSSAHDLWGNRKENSKKESSLSVDSLQKLEVADSSPMPGSFLSTDKLKDIISFLDEVEVDVRSEVLRQTNEDNLSEIGTDIDKSLPGKDSVIESASQVASDISEAINAKKMEIDEKKHSLEMMKKAMGQQKEFTTMQMREMDKEHKQQLQLQRQEYEGTIQRHLTFIDQLIDDKKVLTERCEGLVTKLKDIDEKYSKMIKQMTENHTVELKKQKEVSEAAEKLRREKWIREKTHEIKEITVKGLEPDIQKLIGKHKAEIKKIKAMKQGEVLDADERVGRKYIQHMEDLRSQLEKEKEAEVHKERDIARQKFENHMREEESAFQQQRRRLYQEIEEEKERCATQMQKYKKEFDEKQAVYEESYRQNALLYQEDHSKQIKELQESHNIEMRNYKEQIDIEKQQWIENYMKKQETQLLTKERELKEGVRDARDKEIEMVINRLEQETAASREEAEKTAENRIKRIRTKYESEIKELEHSERCIQEKYNSIKERMGEAEGDSIKLKSECKQKEQELVDMKKITDRLQEERGKVTDIIRQEFADRLVILEEESKRLRNELSEEKARHKFDVDKINATKEEEMDELHKRVKKAITNKDENSKILRQQMLAAEKRAEHLEHLLAEQRKKLLAE